MNGPDPSTFLQLLDLTADGATDRFIGPPSPERGGRTYGGQFLAQAVAAAQRTVDDDRLVHSLHGLFLRPGDVDRATSWEVERVRDGRSFAVRSVVGSQEGKEAFRVLLSLQVPEPGFSYQPSPGFSIADLPEPDAVSMSYVEFCLAHPDVAAAAWFGQDRPMDIRYIDPPDPVSGPPSERPQRTWTRIIGPLPDHPWIHRAGQVYLADATLIDHVVLPHGHRWHDARLTGASLDHAMWFYGDVRADRWLLYDQRVELTGGARGLASGRFYTPDGVLVSTCTQEGLMRWSAGGS